MASTITMTLSIPTEYTTTAVPSLPFDANFAVDPISADIAVIEASVNTEALAPEFVSDLSLSVSSETIGATIIALDGEVDQDGPQT